MTILIIVGIIVLLGIFFASMYNSLVKLRNNRENAFADIDVQLKQRHDLIPRLHRYVPESPGRAFPFRVRHILSQCLLVEG